MNYVKISMLGVLCVSLQILAMETENPDEFLLKVKADCFLDSVAASLKDDLAAYFNGITEYAEVAKLQKKTDNLGER